MNVKRPIARLLSVFRPVRKSRERRSRRRIEARLVGLAGADGGLHGVVDFEDDAFGAVVAVVFWINAKLCAHLQVEVREGFTRSGQLGLMSVSESVSSGESR